MGSTIQGQNIVYKYEDEPETVVTMEDIVVLKRDMARIKSKFKELDVCKRCKDRYKAVTAGVGCCLNLGEEGEIQ